MNGLPGWCAAAFISFATVSVAAADPVLTFTAGSPLPTLDQTVGWQFDVLAPVSVIGLDYFDDGGDGLQNAHTVGIWDPSGTLLTATIVPGLAAAPLVSGQWREITIAPLLLAVGSGYTIGAQTFANSSDRDICGGGPCDPVVISTRPEIQYRFATFSDFGGFQRPTLLSQAPAGFFGPSFAVSEAAAIPEPSSQALLLCALSLAVAVRRAQTVPGSRSA